MWAKHTCKEMSYINSPARFCTGIQSTKREVSIMLFAHIFKARKESGFKFVCYLTRTPSLQGAPVESDYFNGKVAAKSWAASKGAKAWNY